MSKLVDRIGHIESWRYVAAKHQGARRALSDIRHIVIHDMEAPERSTTAEAVAAYFAGGSVVASAHVNIDNDSLVQSVYDTRVAYHAPGASHDGWGIEQAGYARQTRAEWLDAYSLMVIENSSNAAAQLAIKAQIPLDVLSNAGLAANHKGICTHAQVSSVFKRSSHWDPGHGWPMDVWHEYALRWEEYWRKGRMEAEPAPVRDPIPPLDYEVAITWKNSPEEGAARVLGKAHALRVLSPGELAATSVGLVVRLGHGEPGDFTLRGETRSHTAALVAERVCDRDWAAMVRAEGKRIATARMAGQ